MDDWITAIPPKKAKRMEKKKMEEKWRKWEEECPHIMTPEKIGDICKKMYIANLENKLKSEEWIDYQRSGWIFQKVLMKGEHDKTTSKEWDAVNISEEFSTLPLQNKWGDLALFKKYKSPVV